MLSIYHEEGCRFDSLVSDCMLSMTSFWKNEHIVLTGNSKVAKGANVSVAGCLSGTWWLVQDGFGKRQLEQMHETLHRSSSIWQILRHLNDLWSYLPKFSTTQRQCYITSHSFIFIIFYLYYYYYWKKKSLVTA